MEDPALVDHRSAQLKSVLRLLPAPVSIVTSHDADGGGIGLAISALMPVSLEPCAMAICVNRSGSSHDALIRAGRFCINLLHPDQGDCFNPFASAEMRDSRFAHADWRQRDRIWYIEGAPANIFCTIAEQTSYGTHDLIIGKVDDLLTAQCDEIVGWANGRLSRLVPLSVRG